MTSEQYNSLLDWAQRFIDHPMVVELYEARKQMDQAIAHFRRLRRQAVWHLLCLAKASITRGRKLRRAER